MRNQLVTSGPIFLHQMKGFSWPGAGEALLKQVIGIKTIPPGAATGVLALLLISLFMHPAAAAEYTVSPHGGDFSEIQAAVSRAAAGDTIVVQSGTYMEKIRIDKTLIVRGMDSGGGAPVIDPEKKGNAVEITADGCTFTGFVVQNAELQSGIRISSDRTTVTGNTVKNCAQGIYLDSADNCVITGNTITGNARTGIALAGSTSNRIEANAITKNTVGIALDESSPSNRIFLNNFDNNENVASRSVTSVWDSNTALSYRYLGKDTKSPMGNHWSDYRGTDTGGDGIGDIPYTILIGANKRAVLAQNRDVLDRYPLIDPEESYFNVHGAPAITQTPGVPVSLSLVPLPIYSLQGATVEPLPAQPTIPSRLAGWPASLTVALGIFAVVLGISSGALVLLRRHDRKVSVDLARQILPRHSQTVAVIYSVLGGVLALLAFSVMLTLSGASAGKAAITGIWLLCALCIYLCASSVFLAYSTLRTEPCPLIATLHIILAALTVPGVALIMVYAPERREPALFVFILILALSSAIPAWQYRKRPLGSTPIPMMIAEPSAPPVGMTPPKSNTVSTTIVPGQTDVHIPVVQPMVDQKSYFPRELEGRYSDISFVGRGGIAWVYAATRTSDAKKVAVKIPISFDEVTGKSFLNEIKVWEMLHHPNIVEVSAVNILPVPYVEMEYVAGSLEKVAKPIPVWKAVYIIRKIADALRYAHGLGIIHRDIKPHNILVTGDLTPKITDWGMSKVLATDIRQSSIAGFSLAYAAPEQVSPAEFGRTDERTDIYQLGVVFYEIVTGSIPFGGESMVEVGTAILRDPPVPPSEINAGAAAVDRIILKCIEKDPALRYQSAQELLDVLSGYLDEE